MTAENPDDREKQDAAHNPGEKHYDDLVSGGSSADDLNKRENDDYFHPDHPSHEDDWDYNPDPFAEKVPSKNIDAASKKERDAGDSSMNYTGKGGKAQEKPGGKWWNPKNIRKKGPLAFILFAMAGGGGILSILFSPGIALVQLKEIMVGDLNDQASAMELRSDHMLRAKLDNLEGGIGVCTRAVSIRCKFATMSKRQVKNFQKAGFTIDPAEPDKRFGRTKPTSITFPKPDGSPGGVTVRTPQEMRNHLRGNPPAIGQLRKAFNPISSGFWDPKSGKVFGFFKTDKSKKVVGGTDEERDKSITSATSGQAAGVSADGYKTEKDSEGNERKYVNDENGNKIYESGEGSDPGKFKEIADKNAAGLANIADKAKSASIGSKAVSKVSGALSVTGALDTACTIYNTARAVAAAAKASRALQLVQYAMVFFVTADRIKAGVATPEEVSHLGKKITDVDTREMIVDEDSTLGPDGKPQPHENPHLNEDALSGPGYKTAAYNEAPELTSSDLQFAIGGGLVGGLATVMDKVSGVLGGRENVRSKCSVIQSWWARTAGLIAGVVSAVGSFGATTAITIGASIAIGFAMPYLEAALADIIAGVVVSGATKGVDSGNAIFAGSAALLGGLAMARGMKPAKSSEIKSYMAATEETRNNRIAVATLEAQKTPFDINNQYSFLGSAVRKVNPTLIKSTASISGALAGIPAFIATGFSSLVPQVSALQVFNPERYKKCSNDEGYRELGIDADVFCNVRYIMSDKQLAMDPLKAAEWMETNGHINEDGTPKSDEYGNWIKNCTEREDGWGETSNDDNVTDDDIGKTCMIVNETHDNFAVFTMDKGIQEGMDSNFSGGGEESAFLDMETAMSLALANQGAGR